MVNPEFPEWFGRKFHNELGNMPDNEQRRIMQILTQKTKRTAIRKCLAPGGCKRKAVEGHTVPRSVLRSMTQGTTVMTFAKQPVVVEPYSPPTEQPISHTLTGYFACEKHENLFAPIEKEIPDFNNPVHLSLLAYKPLLKAMLDKQVLRVAFEAQAQEDTKSDFPAYMVHLCTMMEYGIGYYKHRAEQALGIATPHPEYDAEPDELLHRVIRVPSKRRAVAVSGWSNGLRSSVTPSPDGGTIELISQAGCTVYPLENEHVVVYHYTAGDEAGIRKSNWHLYNATGETLQRRISQDILRHCEEIVIPVEAWSDFSEEKKQAICDYFMATAPDNGLYIPDAPTVTPVEQWHAKRLRLVNLFN